MLRFRGILQRGVHWATTELRMPSLQRPVSFSRFQLSVVNLFIDTIYLPFVTAFYVLLLIYSYTNITILLYF